jgi:hypothetical protein
MSSHLNIGTLECAWIENLRNGKTFQHNLHIISSFSFIGTKVFLRICDVAKVATIQKLI